MKLAFFIFKYTEFGGLQKNFANICKAVIAQGHELHIYTMLASGEQLSGAHLHVFPPTKKGNHNAAVEFSERCFTEIQRHDYDVHVGFNKMPHLDLYYAADVCFGAEIQEKKSRLTRMLPRYTTFKKLEETVFDTSSKTHIWYLGERTRDQYIDFYATPKARFHYLPPGINRQAIQTVSKQEGLAFRQELGVAQDHKVLVMVGSDFKRKGVDRSIQALAALPDSLKNKTTLLIVGEGKSKPLIRLAQSLSIEKHVIFHGPSKQVPKILAASDYLLHPARVENTGNAILEGIVAGLGVLTTNNCGFAPHVDQAGCGLVCDGESFSQAALNNALTKLIQMDLDSLRAAGLEYADKADLYSRPQKAVAMIEEHYDFMNNTRL